ncbi:MAG: 1-deoxy-D-xylulose-5-phosphate reductoisomerase [bacterium]
MKRKKIAVLGSTGSIGTNALEVIGRYKERYEVVALAAGSNVALLKQQVKQFRPQIVSIRESDHQAVLQEEVKSFHGEVVTGMEGLLQVARYADADMVISAISGSSGLLPTYEAIDAGKTIALANKETLVMAGEIIMEKARTKGIQILPVDSEHSAIFQCMAGHNRKEIRRLLLTASGGPFLFTPLEEFPRITYRDALRHPTWCMGEKISLDSATLMNKGLEVIEAHWLFGVDIQNIEVVIHPESIIHSMVEFWDKNVLALLSTPDMRLPILYALSYPERIPLDLPSLDLPLLGKLSFYGPQHVSKFPCLRLGYHAARQGGTSPAVLNAANEVALEAFKHGRISFPDIPRIIEETLDCHQPVPLREIQDALLADRWARQQARDIIGRLS